MLSRATIEALYFAYGSNLHPQRLHERIGDVVVDAVGELRATELRFHKRGRDGSGKCNVTTAVDPESSVFGAVYGLTADQVRRLDRFESVGVGYVRRRVTVHLAGGGQRRCFTYVAMPDYVDDRLEPFSWYRTLVCLGARFHGFPRPYLARVARQPARADPDPQRAEEERRRIGRVRSSSLRGRDRADATDAR